MNTSHKRSVFNAAAKVAHLTYQIGETDLLRKKSEEVKFSEIKSKKIRRLIFKLKKTLLEYKRLTGKGRGIAGVQVGVPLKIAVIFIEDKLVALINPQIIEKSNTFFSYPEICMSANPLIAKVTRPSWVRVAYLDEFGDKKVWIDKNNKIINRVFQHEIDHLEGIINIDLVESKDLILDSSPDFFKTAKFEKIPQTKNR